MNIRAVAAGYGADSVGIGKQWGFTERYISGDFVCFEGSLIME